MNEGTGRSESKLPHIRDEDRFETIAPFLSVNRNYNYHVHIAVEERNVPHFLQSVNIIQFGWSSNSV
jgi:hypothetical protein